MGDYIENIVNNLKNTYKTSDPFELVDCLDITLITIPLKSVWGMYKYIKRNKTIFLNSELDDYQKRFVLSHELGHAIMHTKSSCFFTNTLANNKLKNEYQANMFAATLLIDLDNMDKLYLQGYSIDQLASYYKVPSELIEFRFKENLFKGSD